MSNWRELLKEAKELFEDGLLDESEYKAEKTRIMALRSQSTSPSSTTPPMPAPPVFQDFGTVVTHPSTVELSIPVGLDDMGTMVGTPDSIPPGAFDNMGTMVGKMGGDTIGSYRIIHLLGEGGMGSVFRGRHINEQYAKAMGDVAIKMIQPSLATDASFKSRFIKEAIFGKKLSHPNIASVIDVVDDGGELALLMDFVDGQELKDLMASNRISVDEVVRLLKPIASALDYLHAQGIVHRDMKPANVRVKPDGTPVILDFGIAKDTNETDSSMTQTGTAMGTQTYMAPEQMDAKRVTGAADQYALAMMAYQMLSGKLPWKASLSSVRITMAKMTGDFNTLESVSSSVNMVVMRGLSLNPEDRYNTCIEFVVEIESAPSDEQLALEAQNLKEAQERIEQKRLEKERKAEDEKTLNLVEEEAKKFFFGLGDPKKYHDNGFGFSLSPAPRYEILSITTHDPQKKISHAYNTLEELAEFCPTRFVVDQNKLHIAVQKVQRIRIWEWGNPKPCLSYDSKSFLGYIVAHGECILELIHNNTAATIRIHLNLTANSVDATSEHKTNRLTIKSPYQGPKPLDVVSFGSGNGRHEMVVIPKGEFTMGALEDDGDAYSDEKPRHKVTLTRDFLMGKYPVTQALWESVMGSNPSGFKGANRPVECVSWFDVVSFCNKLSELEGLDPAYTINGEKVTCNWTAKGYRLPTESEWEYSARAGESFKYAGSDNVDEVAWYDGNSFETHPVGQKKPNGFGLYDMSGNVWEWVWDWRGSYSSDNGTDLVGPGSGSRRVTRGGSWVNGARDAGVSFRNDVAPTRRNAIWGFRLSRNS